MKRRPTSYQTFAAALVLVFLSAVEWPILAQQETAAPQEEPAAPQEPQPISEGEILSRSEFVAADLRRVEVLIEPDAGIARIEGALVDRGVRIVAQLAQLDSIDPNRVSTRRIEDQRLPWLELGAEVAAWESTVQARYVDLRRERERLREELARWELTADSADAAELTPELVGRIDATLTRLRDVETRVRDRRNEVSALAERIATSLEQVAESQQRLDSMTASLRGRLLDRNAEPLWRSPGTAYTGQFASGVVQAGRDWWRSLFTYLGLRRGRAIFLTVCFGLLLLGALQLRRQSRASPADAETTGQVRELIERPFSIAMGLSLAITVLVLPFPVGSASDLLIVLAVVPLIRLGSVVLEPAVQGALWGIAALAILDRIAVLGPEGSPFTRILLLFVTTVTLAGTVWLAMRVRRAAAERAGWRWAAAAAVASATTILPAVAVVANVFGWLDLSTMLTEATVASLFAGIGWAIIVTAATVLLPVVLDGGIGRVLPSLRREKATVCRITSRIVALVAVLAWSHAVLIRFQVWELLRNYATAIADSGFSIGGLTVSTGGILGVILILGTTWLIVRLVGFVIREEVLPRLRMARGAGDSVITLTKYTIYGVGAVMASSALGLGSTQLTVVIGALGVGIGFGLQSIVNNFVSGLILIFERPISVGDTVQTVDHWGVVEHIGIRATTIRSLDGAEIIIPNGDLVSREVINWTRSDELRRIEVFVGVAYGTEPEEVLEVLHRIGNEHPLALADPPPQAHLIRFGESSLDFRLRCWTHVEEWVEVDGDLHLAINTELKKAGIRIPFPQHDLHIHSSSAPDEDEPKTVIEATRGPD